MVCSRQRHTSEAAVVFKALWVTDSWGRSALAGVWSLGSHVFSCSCFSLKPWAQLEVMYIGQSSGRCHLSSDLFTVSKLEYRNFINYYRCFTYEWLIRLRINPSNTDLCAFSGSLSASFKLSPSMKADIWEVGATSPCTVCDCGPEKDGQAEGILLISVFSNFSQTLQDWGKKPRLILKQRFSCQAHLK